MQKRKVFQKESRQTLQITYLLGCADEVAAQFCEGIERVVSRRLAMSH